MKRSSYIRQLLSSISMENEKSQIEKEITIYARITNPQGLEEAYSREEQVQGEIKIDADSRLRVRKTTQKDQEPVYTMTSKIALANEDGLRSFEEKTENIDEPTFTLFIQSLSSYQKKTRYLFNIEKIVAESGEAGDEKALSIDGFKYEVDVFTNTEGKTSEWCKIDLEIQDLEEKFKEAGIDVDTFNITVGASKLPFAPADAFVMSADTSKEDRDKLTQIYDTEFLTFNRNKPETEPVQEENKEPVENNDTEDTSEKTPEENTDDTTTE